MIKTKEYLRGELIFKKGDPINFIAIINRGSINKINEIENKIYNQNEIIGLDSIFSSNPIFNADYYSLSLTTITIYSSEYITSKNTNFMAFLKTLSDEYIKLSIHNSILLKSTSNQKLCAYFYNEYIINNASSFLIKYSKKELAQYLNITNKELTLTLQKLINDNVISNQNKLYTIINLEELKRRT